FLPRAIAASKLILELDPTHTGVQQMLAQMYAKRGVPDPGKKGGSAPVAGNTVQLSTPAPAPAPAAASSASSRAIELPPDPTPAPAASAGQATPSFGEIDLAA